MTEYKPKRRRGDQRKWRIWAFFKRFFVVIGIASTISTTLVFMTFFRAANYTPPPIKDNLVLTYTFKSTLPEINGKPSLTNPLLRPSTTLHEVVQALEMASKDDRVKGLVVRMTDIHYSLAQVQELRDAVHKFRKNGKFAHVFSDSFGGFSSGMSSYYLASAFDEIWMQPIGMVSINGLHSETPFLKNVLDKFGVSPEMDRRGVYKTSPESLTKNKMGKEQREMMTGLLQSLSDQIVTGISKDRGFEEKHTWSLINNSPFMEEEAKRVKLIDKIGYMDQMVSYSKDKVQGIADIKPDAKEDAKAEDKGKAGVENKAEDKIKAEDEGDTDDVAEQEAQEDVYLSSLIGYAFQARLEKHKGGMVGFVSNFLHNDDMSANGKDKSKLALIYAMGTVMPGSTKSMSGFYTLAGGPMMAASKISRAIRSAADNDDVKAIILRVDSPGGSPSASETIYRAIKQAQEKGKPVIISMGSVAASGGYWIAAPADKIVAQPATITGSIGVFAGKFVLSDLWKKIGVRWDAVSIGENADMWSMNTSFSKAEEKKFQFMLDNIYNAFLNRVAEGRKMDKEKVRSLAEGRVWTGKQAHEHGLVDALGGLNAAIDEAKILAELDISEDIPVLLYPARKSGLELVMEILFEGVSDTTSINVSALAPFDKVMQRMAVMSLPPEVSATRMPDF